MKRLLISSLIVAGSSTAFAADQIIDEVAFVDEAFSWSGFYAGISGGYGAGNSDLFIADSGVGEVNASLELDGVIGGIHAGGNHQLANGFVLGAEADLLSYALDGSTIFALITGGAGLGAELDGHVTWSGSARVRVGYAFDRTLPYITAGIAAAEYEATIVVITGDEGFSHDETHVGWTVGAGIEHALTDNVLVRVEYRYSDFGSEPLVPDAIAENGLSLRAHDLRAGLSYKF